MSSLNWGDLVRDAGDVAGGNYEPLPDGDYDLKVVEATSSTTSTGKTMFKIKAEVQGGAYAKRLIWDNLVISPENKNALGIFFAKMNALGVPREFFSNNNPTNAQIEASISGKSFRAQIGSRVWQGEKKNEIKKYYVLGNAAAPAPAAAAPVAPPAPPAPPAAPAPAPAPAPASAPADAPF